MSAPTSLHVTGLGKQKLSKLASKAKRMGMTTSQYVMHLIDDDLALDHVARTKTFASIVGPGKEVDEQELDQLVERAKARHHRRVTKNNP